MNNIEMRQGIIDYDNKFRFIVSNFVDKHPYITYKLTFIFVLWVILSISCISMLAIVGMDKADTELQNRHLNGVDDPSYNNWNSIVKPIFPYMLYTMQFLVILFMILLFYVLIVAVIPRYIL